MSIGGSALRRDECGDWRLRGRYGHIYTVSPERSAKQGAERPGLDNSSAMLDHRRGDSSLQCTRRVRLGATGGDCVPKHLPDGRAKPLRGLELAAKFEGPEHGENFGRADVLDRS